MDGTVDAWSGVEIISHFLGRTRLPVNVSKYVQGARHLLHVSKDSLVSTLNPCTSDLNRRMFPLAKTRRPEVRAGSRVHQVDLKPPLVGLYVSLKFLLSTSLEPCFAAVGQTPA